jgi:hypothetical protein
VGADARLQAAGGRQPGNEMEGGEMTREKVLLDGLTEAIDRSQTHNEIGHVSVDDMDAAIQCLVAMWDEDVDYVEGVGIGDRKGTDIWGCDESGEQVWRLFLYVDAIDA